MPLESSNLPDRRWGAIVATVDPSRSVEELVEDYVYRLHHKMFPVTDGDRLLGCVKTRDVQRVPRNEWAAEQDDAVTSDLFTEIGREVDKSLYFLESHLQA